VGQPGPGTSSWEVGADPAEVHALLCACDAHQSTPEAPAPKRNPETTRRRVEAGEVHLLRQGGEAIAMFTLSWDAPFGDDLSTFPVARRPAYLGRLAVHPELLEGGSIVGAGCLRRAVELARAGGADALRAQANPDVANVLALLTAFGFEQCGPVLSDGERRRVHLQKPLPSAAS
jgi:hypothetical protein